MIIKPSLEHKFRVEFTTLDDSVNFDVDVLTRQLIECSYSITDNTITVLLEEDAAGDLVDEILSIRKRKFEIMVGNTTDDVNEDTSNTHFVGAKLKKHKCKRNYAATGTVKHELIFKFKNVYLSSRTNK